MFLHDSRLPHILRPDDYFSSEQFARERSDIFSSCWHPVATTSDLADEGSFVTATIADTPVIIWRSQGSLHAFLNVCAHRFSQITCASRGCAQTLKCQYHGWEYNASGQTQRIPEAHGFKPWEHEGHALRRFQTATIGQMVFVCLCNDATGLATIAGSQALQWETLLSSDRRSSALLELNIAANWKVVVENAIESYHLESVHRNTFRRNPPAEMCSHEFGEWGSAFRTNSPPVSRLQRLLDKTMYHAIGIEPDTSYFHCLIYPNIMFGSAGMFTWLHVVEPIDPVHCRTRLWMFVEPGKTNPLSWGFSRLLSYGARRFTQKAMLEDLAAVEGVQRGLQAAEPDATGCLSPREERVWHFQQFVSERTGQQATLPHMNKLRETA